MKPIKEIGRAMWAIFMEGDKSHLATLSDKQTSKEHDEHVTVYRDDERRELVRAVWEAARSVSGSMTNYYTHGDDVEEFIKEQGL